MVQSAMLIRALIASPSDVGAERQAIEEVIAAWNASNSWDRGLIIEPVKWETHSVPLNADRPQGLLNTQLVGKCDFVITDTRKKAHLLRCAQSRQRRSLQKNRLTCI